MLNFALSIRQPWAWAVVHAGRDIENRSWESSFRGRFYIHAAERMTRDDYHAFVTFTQDSFRFTEPPRIPAPAELQRGGIIAEAELADCVREHDSPWFMGPNGLVLRNVKPLLFRPLKGEPGLFVVEPDAEAS